MLKIKAMTVQAYIYICIYRKRCKQHKC